MNHRPLTESVQTRMMQVRCEIDDDVKDLVGSARSMIDWRHYVRAHPWVCLGTAVALGFMMARRRSAVKHPDLAASTLPARTSQAVANPVPAIARGLVDALLATIVSITIRKGTELLGLGTASFLGTRSDAPRDPPRDFESSSDVAGRRG